MKCPACQLALPEGATRCSGCGASLPFPRDSQWSSRPPAWMWLATGCAVLAGVGLLGLLGAGALLVLRFL